MPGNLVKLFCLWPRPAWVINEGMGDVTQAHPGEQPKNEENRYDFI